ncbi:MAG: Calx-beta domain-containing protein, partial [Planctomycetota bacterium]
MNIQTVNCNQDWAEGDDPNRFNSFGWTEGTAAATSEYAQTHWYDDGGTPTLDVAKCITWQKEDGTPVSAFKFLPASFTNTAGLTGSDADHGSYISALLDENVVNDLLNNAKNRGLRLYKSTGENCQNYTREAVSGNRPYLEVVYIGGSNPDIGFYQVTSDRGEEITTIKLRVVLSETSTQTVTVDYAATGGTATGGGVDYTLNPGTLTFLPGETTKFIDVDIVDDPGEDPDETIVVTLSDPVNGQLGTNTTHTFTILDDDRTGTTWNVDTYSELRTACQLCQPCDEIIIAPGTYYLVSVYLQLNSHHVIIRGSTGDPDDVVICGHGMNVDQEPYEGLIVGDDSITVMDLTVKSMWGYGIHIRVHLDVDDAWINNVVTLNIGERHFKGSNGPGVSDDVIIENTYMLQTEARQTRPGHPVDPDNYIGGIDCMATNGWIIRDNIAEGIVGATGGGRGAIFLWNGVEDPTIERNRFFDCASGINIGNASGPTDSHVHPWHSVGGIIRNNFIGSFLGLELCNTKDMKVYNNTIYTPDATYFRTLHIYDEPGEGLTTNLSMINNIIRGKILDNSSGDWSKAAVIAMGNIVDDVGTQVTSDWFVDVATGDFHLTANATDAIDEGTVLGDVTDDFDKEARGAQPDLGGDEYQGVTLPTVTLSATDADAAEEGQDTGTFTFTRDQTSGNLVVNYSVGGTA